MWYDVVWGGRLIPKSMEVSFESGKHKKLCENEKKIQRKYGSEQAEKILLRIRQFKAAVNLYDIYVLPQMRLHPLKENRNGCLAVDLLHPYRLVFRPVDGVLSDYATITKVMIINLREDYH